MRKTEITQLQNLMFSFIILENENSQQWTEDEKRTLKKAFHYHYLQAKVPSVFDVRNQLEKFPTLKNRVNVIRDKIRNDLKKQNK